MAIERCLGRLNQFRMIGETEIVVRAHVEDAFAAGDGNVGVLRRGDDPLGFEKSLRLYFFERLRKLLLKFGEHKTVSIKRRAMQNAQIAHQSRQPWATSSGTFSVSLTSLAGEITTFPNSTCVFRKSPSWSDQTLL